MSEEMGGFTFTDDEWELVRITPWIIGAAVMEVDEGSPFSVLREIGAVDRQIDQALRSDERLALVKMIARDLTAARSSGRPVDREWLDDSLGQLAGALAIVEAKVPDDDSRDFREWLYEIAVDAAEAAREHWRVRGARVSAEEQELLDQLAVSLAVG